MSDIYTAVNSKLAATRTECDQRRMFENRIRELNGLNDYTIRKAIEKFNNTIEEIDRTMDLSQYINKNTSDQYETEIITAVANAVAEITNKIKSDCDDKIRRTTYHEDTGGGE